MGEKDGEGLYHPVYVDFQGGTVGQKQYSFAT